MMKKLVTALLTLAMLLGMLPAALAVPASATTASTLDDHLITHWDFEGTGAEALKDKAPKGSSTVDDTMVLQGYATAENGLAYIYDNKNDTNTNALYANDSAELMRTTVDRTIYIRFRSEKTLSNTDVIAIASQNGALRLGINGDGNKFFGSTNPHKMGENSCSATGMTTYTPNTWITVAVSYDKTQESSTFTVSTYFKVGDGEWIATSVDRTDDTQTWTEDNSDSGKTDSNALIFGRLTQNNFVSTWGGNLIFDDIRIYNTPLSLDDVKSVEDEVLAFEQTSLNQKMITYWDFEGSKPLADKATSGKAEDTLVEGIGAGGVSIKDGVVTLQSGMYNYLYAADSADLLRTTEDRSIYLRFRTDSFSVTNELMSQNSAFRLFNVTGKNEFGATTNPLQMGQNGIWGSTTVALEANTWYSLAICYNKNYPNSNTVTISMYILDEQGNVLAQATVDHGNIVSDYWTNDSKNADGDATIVDGSASGKDSLYIGRLYHGGTTDCTLQFDDIRIYNKALLLPNFQSIKVNDGRVQSEGHSLSLGGNIGVNFYLYAKSELCNKDNVSVTVKNGTRVLLNAKFDEVHRTTVVDGAYKFTANVAAKEMTDTLTLEVKEGSTVLYTETYSVRQYADEILSGGYSAEVVALVKAMLNYGAYAQTYFDYQTTALANAGLNIPLVNVTQDKVNYKVVTTGSVTGLQGLTATLKLESMTQLVYTATFAAGVDVSKYTFAYNGEKVTPASVSGQTVTIITDGINIQNIDERQGLDITKGSETLHVSYAPMTYIMNELDTSNAKLKDLLNSLYAYYHAAKIYGNADLVNTYGIINYTAGEGLLYNGINIYADGYGYATAIDATSEAVVQAKYLMEQYRPEVIDITVGRQLFVDNFLIHDTTNLTTKYYQAEKYEGVYNGAIFSQAWTNVGTSAGGVWYDMDEQKYKMWYDIGFNPAMGYAESYDGINWAPVEVVNGSVGNEIFGDLTDPATGDKNGTSSVFIDYETTDPDERYKMLVHSLNNQVVKDGSTVLNGYETLSGDVDENSYYSTLYVSADGLNWVPKEGTANGASGDMTTAFYNAFTHKWVNSLRGYITDATTNGGKNNDERARWYAESDTFEGLLDWGTNDAVLWLKTDKNDKRVDSDGDGIADTDAQQYNFNAIAYESIMLGTYTIWYGPENGVVDKTGNPKINEIQMAYSRDGYYYDRPDRTSFIGASKSGWDKGYLFGSIGGIIVKDDLLYIYYSAMDGIGSDGNANGHATQRVGLATLRRDGFASLSLNENASTGEMLTRMLTVNEGKQYLFVNYDGGTNGTLKARVIDKDGNPVDGYTYGDCNAVSGDGTCMQITWKNGEDLSFLNGSEFRLQFYMEGGEGDFYSFWLSDSMDGRSGGAIAAGYDAN